MVGRSPLRIQARFHSSVAFIFAWSLASRTILASAYEAWEFPSKIKLHAGVLHAPPFAVVNEEGTTFEGFQPDLLERMKIFAKQDNITLEVTLDRSPDLYNEALNLVANDCNTTINPNSIENCTYYDFIVGDYYMNPDRSLRVDFTPPMLKTTMTTIKYLDKSGPDYTTLTQAEQAGATVCVPDGTYLMGVVMEKFPKANFLRCPTQDVCLQDLKAEKCSLYADDELQLRHRAANDHTLQVTREQFNTQYTVWPMSYSLDPVVSLLMKRWLYAAISNTTIDMLFFMYFKKELCPVGTAGESCELPCDPDHGTSDERGICQCESTRWIGADCSIEVEQELNLLPQWLIIIGLTMFGVNCLASLVCGLWLWLHRKTPQVSFAQPFFLSLVLLGCLISSSTIIPLGMQSSGEGDIKSCMSLPWLYSIGFSITFGTLFAKIRRVHLVFKKAAQMKRTVVTFQETLAIIGTVLAVDVTILIVWTIQDSLVWVRLTETQDVFGYPMESNGFCASENWIIYASLIGILHLSLLGFASYLCYATRNVPTKFSESKYLAIAMLSNLQIFVVGLPVLLLVGSDPTTSYFVRCAIVWMNDFVVLLLIFVPLMWSVWKGDDKGDVVTQVSAAMKRYSISKQMHAERGSSNFSVSSPQRVRPVYNIPLGDASPPSTVQEVEYEEDSHHGGNGNGNGIECPEPMSMGSSSCSEQSRRNVPSFESHSAHSALPMLSTLKSSEHCHFESTIFSETTLSETTTPVSSSAEGMRRESLSGGEPQKPHSFKELKQEQ